MRKHNLTLNGITGVIFGITSITFSWFINLILTNFSSGVGIAGFLPISFFEIILGLISILFILISYLLIVLINRKRRKNLGLKGWDSQAKKIRLIYVAFLILGGISGVLLIQTGLIKLIIPVSLIIYGTSSIISNKYTFGNTLILGVFFILNGFFSILFPKFQLLIWAMAFGGYHIVYGVFYSLIKPKN